MAATSCRTSPNNSVNKQSNETVRAKYNLLGFSGVLSKTTTSNEHYPSFLEKVLCDVEVSLENSEVNNSGITPNILFKKIYTKEISLDSGERDSGERNSFSRPCRPTRRRCVYSNSLLSESTLKRDLQFIILIREN